jgi:hypothetical protein
MFSSSPAIKALPLLGLASVLATGCGPTKGDDTGPSTSDGPLYLASTWVSDVDSTNTYVSVFDSLEMEELDLSTAIEVPGWADAWVFEQWVFIADGESPAVSRYSLDEEGALVLDATVSFANYGVASSAFWNQQILSRTKAFLANDAAREYVVWNPETMEITGTVPWPAVTFEEGLLPYHSYTDRGGVVAGGYFFHGIYGHNDYWDYFGDTSYVGVYDIVTEELVTTIEVPCPMMDVASLGDDGFLYVSGWSYMPLSVGAGNSDTNCAARIDVATRTLDASWTLDYPGVTGGDEGSALRAVSGDAGILAVFHGSGVEVTEDMDMWALDAGADDWELYGIDLATRQVAPTGIKMGDGSYYESHVDDRYFVYLGSGDDTQVYERAEGGSYESRFVAPGWMSRLFRLR